MMQRFISSPAAAQVLGDREVGVIAATDQLARDGHVLDVAGVDLTAYRRNPVVLWSHIPEQPVGACTAVGIETGSLAARIQFAPPGASATADEICALVKSGIVKGISIGFNPIDAEPLDPAQGLRAGARITSSELLEISFVAIPADTGAGVVSRSFTARPGAMALLRSLPAVYGYAVDTVLKRIAQRPPVPLAALSPREQFEIDRQRTMTAWACMRAREVEERDSCEQRRAEVRELEELGRKY